MPASPAAPPARSPFWDIVRGIGIVSIVMGHCFSKAKEFLAEIYVLYDGFYPAS